MSPQHPIAHYRIVSKLGEGGMGAVYRATDTKLNRDVPGSDSESTRPVRLSLLLNFYDELVRKVGWK